jgi:RNA polymerase sigma-70 factor (ECF subfamily)
MTKRNGNRRQVYCVVPGHLAAELHDALRNYWRDDPTIEVVIDARRGERRRGERRVATSERFPGDRRRPSGSGGRRQGDRRATPMAVSAPPLPPFARPYADDLRFVERLEPVTERAEDTDTDQMIARIQSGSYEEFATLYMRYYDRLYAYLRLALRDGHEAEDVTQEVFLTVLDGLPRYEIRGDTPFRAWLFHVGRNHAIDQLRKRTHIELEPPTRIDRRLASRSTTLSNVGLGWVSDSRLLALIERLPLAQRQVLTLRHLIGLTTADIAAALKRSPGAIHNLESRAVRRLEHRLRPAESGRERRSRPEPMVTRVKRLPVLRSRRFALSNSMTPAPAQFRSAAFLRR